MRAPWGHGGVPRKPQGQAFPTPRGYEKSDPKGGVVRLPDVVARRLWWVGTTAQCAPSRKPRNAVVGVQFR